MEISNRLKAICDLCDKGKVVADIGCDHGYVSITLTNNGIFDKALAMDINEGPLKLARENIRLYGDDSKIETRLSNGLEKLEAGEADTIIIAGMGGLLIRDILKAGESKLSSVKQLILGAQSDLDKVRKYVREINFIIIDEEMILEDGKYYQLIKAERADGPVDLVEVYQDIYDMFGPCLLSKQHDVLYAYLNHQKVVYDGILSKLSGKEDERIMDRVKELTKELDTINKALDMFKK